MKLKIAPMPWYKRLVFGFAGSGLCALFTIVMIAFMVMATSALPFIAVFFPEFIDKEKEE